MEEKKTTNTVPGKPRCTGSVCSDLLSDHQCNEFRRLPCSFNNMVRSIYIEGMSNAFIDIEDHPQFEAFVRAFWRRIEPYKNEYGKELPEKMPVEFKAHMITATTCL